MANGNGDPIGVFISHRVEDRELAELLSSHLATLSQNRVKPMTCYDIPGARDYRQEIISYIQKSRILVYLHTLENADLSWCMLEAGVFIGSKKPDERHLICLSKQGLASPPTMIENLQDYKSTEEGIEKFLTDLIIGGEFTGGTRLSSDPHVFFQHLKPAADSLVDSFLQHGLEGNVPTSILIVHRSEDRVLAGTIRNSLITLNHNLRVTTCDELQELRNYDEDVVSRIRDAKVCIFLHTQDDTDIRRCMLGAGIYIGAKKPAERHLICLMNQLLENPPAMIERMKIYPANRLNIQKLLENLVNNGKYTGKAKDPSEIQRDSAKFQQAVLDIEREFSYSITATEYFSKRVSIEFPDAHKSEAPVAIDKAIITANKETLKLLGVENECRWPVLYETCEQRAQKAWLDEIKDIVRRIESRQPPNLEKLTPFTAYSGERKYVPVLARIEKKLNRPIRLIVIFLEEFAQVIPGPTLGPFFGQMPSKDRDMSMLISQALRLRWEILEPFRARLRTSDVKCAALSAELYHHLKEYERSLGENAAQVINFYPPEERATVEKGIAVWQQAMTTLQRLVSEPDDEAFELAFQQMLWCNKLILLKSTSVCIDNLTEIIPFDFDENSPPIE